MINILNNTIQLFFPILCPGCEHPLSTNEKVLCTQCRHDLPITNYHLYKRNPVEKIFYGRVKIESGTSLLSYKGDGIVKNLMHNMKYRGQETVGRLLGHLSGSFLEENSAFKEVDMVIPIPLHNSRLRTRGYNQVAPFGQVLAERLKTHYEDTVLKRKRATKRLAFQKRKDRWESLETAFYLRGVEKIHGKHILLVDDIVTTGATLEACSLELLKAPGVRISIATMAIVE